MTAWKMKKRYWLSILTASLVTVGVSGTAVAQNELQDDFSGGTWQDCLWNPYERLGGEVTYHNWEGTEGNSVRVQDGKLELELPANTYAGMSWELGLESKFLLAGDFEAQVEFEISTTQYWTSLDVRGVNMLFVELMAGDQGTRRRHVRGTNLEVQDQAKLQAAHLWLSNPGHNKVTQINTDTQEWLREIDVGVRPGRTAVDLEGNVYVHNRGNSWGSGNTTVTFIKASACPDPECDLNNEPDHIYTIDFSGGGYGGPNIDNGKWGGGVAVDKNNDLWVAFRGTPTVVHMSYLPSDVPGNDEWVLNETYDISSSTIGSTGRPYGMAIGRDGSVWLATRGSSPEAFIRINPLSGQTTNFPMPADNCINVYGMAIDSEQRLFRSTFQRNNNECTAYRFDPSEPDEDARWMELDSDAEHDGGARGVAADSQGRIWVAGDHRSKLVAFDSETGARVASIDTCRHPAGVALDRNNLLWASCRSGNTGNDQVRWYNMNGAELGRMGSLATYTYSDMTGYQLRNFGLDDWQETFELITDESIGEYYISSVENNYGGGLEYGAGGENSFEPSDAPWVPHPDMVASSFAPEPHRMRVSSRHYSNRVSRIASHPARLEGVWGFRTPAEDALDEVPFRFTLTEDSYVYVAFEEVAQPVPSWLRGGQGWTSTDEIVESTDSNRNYKLYRKHFDAGEEADLGNANDYPGNPPTGSPFMNYFVYVYPDSLETEAPASPEAIIQDPGGNTVSLYGRLRIERSGSDWTFSYQDGGSTTWRTMNRQDGPTGAVPMRLRTRLDPFWHSGVAGDVGGSIHIRYDNFMVNSVDSVPGSPYCSEGCDENTPGYGSNCAGGDEGLCPGTLDCVDDKLECVIETRSERCNGFDDDCDGFVDHNANNLDFRDQTLTGGFIVEDYGMPGTHPTTTETVTEGGSCQSEFSGDCQDGYWECVGGAMQCQPYQLPQDEICDGLDNSCDGQVNQDSQDPLVRLGRYVQAGQRSLPNTPIRPVVPENGEGFQTYMGYDGFNVDPQEPDLVEEGVARVIFYLDPTINGDDANEQLGEYVLYLAHGAASTDQGDAAASYSLTFNNNIGPANLVMQDGLVKEQVIANQGRMQHITVQSSEGQSGGVGLAGAFDSTDDWNVKISAHFSGDIQRWELYNAITGEGIEISANEELTLSNNSLDGLGGSLTSEVGQICDTGQEGICGRGMALCQENGGVWGMECLSQVVKQLEVCDGRDNSCSGDIDYNDNYGFALPIVQYQQGNGWGGFKDDDWEDIQTADLTQSASDMLNFTRRSGGSYGPAVGSSVIRDVADPTRSLQEVNRSLWTIHRDTRFGNGTLALVMAHGRSVQGSGAPDSTATVKVKVWHREAPESFLGWFDDMEDQQDDSYFTEADSFESQNPQGNGNPFYEMDWELHRWVDGDTANREADSAAIVDLFAEELAGDFPGTANLVMLEIDGNGINDWRYHSPYQGDGLVDLDMNQRVAFRIDPAVAGDYNNLDSATCVIQENDDPTCLGQEDIYTCQDGQITCGIGRDGCCSPDHPNYDQPCGQDDPQFENTGACYSAMRCDGDERWECQQVQSPEPEMCDGLDNTCDGLVDGFETGFEYKEEWGGDGLIDECPEGSATCGPRECNFRQVCVCGTEGAEDRDCICIDSLEEVLVAPHERICENHERLEDDKCVSVASMPGE